MAVKAQNQVTILDVTDSYSIILSNENQTFPETGVNQGAAQISSTTVVRAYRGSEEMWVWLANPVEAVDTTDSTLKLTINKTATKSTKGLTLNITTNKAGWKNSGKLTLPILVFDREVSNPTSSSTGYLVTLDKDFTYSVASYGNTGAAPTTYDLTTTATQITVNSSGTINPPNITVAAIQQTGSEAYVDFVGAGIAVVGHPATGSDVAIGSSTSQQSYVTFTPSTDYIYYIATLTVNGKVVDRQTIGVSKDGADGEDAFMIDITSSNGFIFKNTAIATTLTAHVYSGGTEFDNDDYDDTSGHYGFGTQAAPLYVNWYKNDVEVGTGISYQVVAGNVTSLATFTAKLEDTKWSSN